MPKRKPVPSLKSDGELSSDDLDKVTGGTPVVAPPVPIPYPNIAISNDHRPAPALDDALREAGFD